MQTNDLRMKRKGWRRLAIRHGGDYVRNIGPLGLRCWYTNGFWWAAINHGASIRGRSPDGAAAKIELKAAALFAKWLKAT